MLKHTLLVVLALGSLLVALGQGRNSATYYYISMGPDSAVMEITTDGSQAPVIDGGEWRPISLTELDAAGIDTPSENEAAAYALGLISSEEATITGFHARAWLNVGSLLPSTKWLIGGASSSRDVYNPGRLRVMGTLYRTEVELDRKDSGPQWGWSVKVQSKKMQWSDAQAYEWREHGGHWYGNEWYYSNCRAWF